MRVERLRVGAFGRLRGLDTGEVPLSGLVAVHGPNEAGKTTFFHFLTTLLYGFQPATRESHPYAPWAGGDVEGEALLRMEGGEAWEVRRRLLSSPSGSLVRGAGSEELRNRALPCVEHVPRAVFRQVYALTLAELAGLEGESWAAVQDRLLGAMGATDLRSARVVAAELEREAGERWRPNRRGRQRVRELKAQLVELRRRREAALALDRRLRDVTAALEAARRELRELRAERSACRVYLERHRSLLPVRAQLRRVSALEAEAGDPAELEGLPPDPGAHLQALEARLEEVEELLARNAHETREPRTRIEAFGAAEEHLVRRGDALRAVLARALAFDPERVRRGQLEQEVRDLHRRAEALAGELLSKGGEVETEVARAVSVADLREAIGAYSAARDARTLAEEAARQAAGIGPAGLPAWAGWLALTVAAVALWIGFDARSLTITALAAPLLAGGVAILVAGAARREDRRRAARARERVDEARAAEEGVRTAVLARLQGLAVREALLATPDTELVDALERLQALLRDREDRVRSLETLEVRADELAASVGALARELRVEVPPDPLASAHLLSERLRQAEARREAALGARRELERLMRERSRLRSDHERVRSERDALVERLERLGSGELARGTRSAHTRLEARELARRLRDELARAHPELDALSARIAEAEAAGEDWTVDPSALARRGAREEELTDEIEALARRTEGLARDVERLLESETADAVEGEILVLEETLSETRRERDRLWVLARLLREAERRFREEHQPDILRDAGGHLATITGGRYRRILMDEGGAEGSFLLHSPDAPGSVHVGEPISTGTREQVYLALRLAIVDHLDRGGERLPLFLDEAFVNWDPERFERGLDLLGALAERRQVFLFSCHPQVVARMQARGARVVRLERAS